ncbi:uncharacterized protein [Typha angustifolia]|uniref:uncharacterized protein n=1 Tax=Typha angustifolia TaxID=59011 RepID=UPI003C2EB1C4
MAEAPIEPPLSPRKRFSALRGVRWRIDLGILPSTPSASVDDLRRAAADCRRRYARLRRHLLVDPHLSKDEDRSSDLVMDNPLSQSPDSTWGRFFRNAELEKMVDQDLSRLYPEDGSYFQTPACQAILRRILLLWCLRHPEYGYRQGMHELLAPLIYVLHVDLDHLSQVRKLHEDCFIDKFDRASLAENDMVSNYRFRKDRKCNLVTFKTNSSQETTPKVSNLDEFDPDIKDIFLLCDSYGAEGELGIILSERFLEHDAYCMFDGLMNGVHGIVAMADFFSSSPSTGSSISLPPIIEASSALYHLLSIVDSSLHCHLVELGIEPQYFSLRWLRVLFGREFSLDDLLILWDELFASSNSMYISDNTEYRFWLLCSARGALIAAMAVSMLIHLRSSLLATENATSCLQRLLNFPKNIDMEKLIEKAKSLEVITLEANISTSSYRISSSSNKSAVTRVYSLQSGSASPRTLLHPIPDSYWEEKWRVLNRSETISKETENNSYSTGTTKKSLDERSGLSRMESDPSPMKNRRGKNAWSSVRRKLFDSLSSDIEKSEADDVKSLRDKIPVVSGNESLSFQVNVEEHPSKEPDVQNTMQRTSDFTAEEANLSGEYSSVLSTASSPSIMGNDHDNDSDKSSVTSNSSVGHNDEETTHMEEPCGQDYHSQEVRDLGTNSTVKPRLDGSLEKAEVSKPLSSKFQWFWKLGRASDEGNMANSRSEESQRPSSGNISKDRLQTSDTDGSCNSCGVSRRTDVGDKKVVGTLKNLGQSILENIQVIESAFQQDSSQLSSLETLSNNILGGKGQVTAVAALKELRKISNLLCEM